MSKDKVKWQAAMEDEMTFLHKNNTRELVARSKKSKLIECRWLFKIKDGVSPSEPQRYKIMLNTKGYTQRESIDFSEVRIFSYS